MLDIGRLPSNQTEAQLDEPPNGVTFVF